MLIGISMIIQLGVGHGIFERRPPNGKLSSPKSIMENLHKMFQAQDMLTDLP